MYSGASFKNLLARRCASSGVEAVNVTSIKSESVLLRFTVERPLRFEYEYLFCSSFERSLYISFVLSISFIVSASCNEALISV